MNKTHSFLLVLFLTSCASPSYVLHWREPKDLFKSYESTSIANVDDVALLYDRAQWVVIEPVLDDGSTWVNYAVTIKNSSSKTIKIKASEVRLEDSLKNDIHATFDKKDLDDKKLGTIASNTYYRVNVKFHISSTMAHTHGDSANPISLIVPLDNGKELQQKVWLWKE